MYILTLGPQCSNLFLNMFLPSWVTGTGIEKVCMACDHSSHRHWAPCLIIVCSLELQTHLTLQFWHQKRENGLDTSAMNPNHPAAFWTWHGTSANTKATLFPRDFRILLVLFACCVLIFWWSAKVVPVSGTVSALAREESLFCLILPHFFVIAGDKSKDSVDSWREFHWNIWWHYECYGWRSKGRENHTLKCLFFF